MEVYRFSHGVMAAIVALVIAIALPAAQAQSLAPAPAPASDGPKVKPAPLELLIPFKGDHLSRNSLRLMDPSLMYLLVRYRIMKDSYLWPKYVAHLTFTNFSGILKRSLLPTLHIETLKLLDPSSDR